MKVQKYIFLLLIAMMAVGYKNESGFMGCNGCHGCNGCTEEALTNSFFGHNPFAVMFSLSGGEKFGAFGPTGNGTNDPDIIAGIGAKYFLTDHIAARALLRFSRWSNGESDANNTKTNSLWGIGVGAEYHATPLYRISPYAGFGVGVTSASIQGHLSTFKSGTVSGQQQQAAPASDTSASYTGIGVTLNAGFDWYPFHNIGIGSEYSIGYSTIAGKQKLGTVETDLPTLTRFGITGGFNIHVLVHF